MAIDLTTETLNGKSIKEWQVWWRSATGLHKTLSEALLAAQLEEMPSMYLKAVPVAITEDGSYEERP